MKYFKSICLISAFCILTGCDSPYIIDKTPRNTTAAKTIPSKTAKKPVKEKLLLKLLITQLSIISIILNILILKMSFWLEKWIKSILK